MSRASLLGLVGLAAACGGGPRAVAPGGASACPPAAQVRYAEGREGVWAVRLGYLADGVRDLAPGVLDPSNVINHGFATVPPTVWVLRVGEPPCAASLTGYVGDELVDPAGVQVSALLDGCGPADGGAHAWISLAPVAATCSVEPAVPIGRFAGDPEAAPVAPPAPWTELVVDDTCRAPCRTWWELTATATEPAIAEVLTTSITPGAPEEECAWPSIDAHALVAVSQTGAITTLEVPRWDSGFDDATLDAVLAEGDRPVVALVTDLGDWGAYELTAEGTLGAGVQGQTHQPHDEARVHRSLAMDCGP